jgi:type VI secretion system secreted protein VgrG
MDNQRLQPRGHGLDLATNAWGALRAGSGMLLSAHVRPGSQAGSHQVDAREPQAAIQQAQEQAKTLADSAQAHQAKLAGEVAPDKLDTHLGMGSLIESLDATDSNGDAGTARDDEAAIGGGVGTVSAWSRPEMVTAAPGGIGTYTPASTLVSAGRTMAVVAGQDLHAIAQANHATSVAKGVVFYTYGKATDPNKPNQETGIKLHAASGSVYSESKSGATTLTASKSVEVSSTTSKVKVTAPQHVLLTAAGAALHIEGGDITINGPGKVEFKAAMKELTSGSSANASLSLSKPAVLRGCAMKLSAATQSGAAGVPR